MVGHGTFLLVLGVLVAVAATCNATAFVAEHDTTIRVEKVVIHQRMAVVYGSLTLAAPEAGAMVVVVRNVTSNSVNESTVQFIPDMPKELHVERMMWETTQAKAVNETALRDEAARLKRAQADLREENFGLQQYIRYLDSIGERVASNGGSPPHSRNGKPPGNGDGAARDLRSDPDADFAAIEKHYEKHTAATKKSIALRREMDELAIAWRAIQDQLSRTDRVAKLFLNAQRAGNHTVQVTFVLDGASWEPQYDLKMDTKTQTLVLGYNALVRQTSAMDWTNVTVVLSTGKPVFDKRMPELDPWKLRLVTESSYHAEQAMLNEMVNQQHQQKYANQFQNTHQREPASRTKKAKKGRQDLQEEGIDVAGDRVKTTLAPMDAVESMAPPDAAIPDAEPEPEPEPELSQVVAGAVSDVFELRGTHTIVAGSEVRLSVAEVTLAVSLQFACVPKKTPNVFVRGEVINESPYTFVPGRSLVFLDGSFVSAGSVPLVLPGGTVMIDLGVDDAVKVSRQLVRQYTSTTGLLTKVVHDRSEFAISIKNKRAVAVNLTVHDQFPVSSNERVTVELVAPAFVEGRFEDPKQGASAQLVSDGIMKWTVVVPSDGKTKLDLKYVITHPADHVAL